jgi:hypothetical protein
MSKILPMKIVDSRRIMSVPQVVENHRSLPASAQTEDRAAAKAFFCWQNHRNTRIERGQKVIDAMCGRCDVSGVRDKGDRGSRGGIGGEV